MTPGVIIGAVVILASSSSRLSNSWECGGVGGFQWLKSLFLSSTPSSLNLLISSFTLPVGVKTHLAAAFWYCYYYLLICNYCSHFEVDWMCPSRLTNCPTLPYFLPDVSAALRAPFGLCGLDFFDSWVVTKALLAQIRLVAYLKCYLNGNSPVSSLSNRSCLHFTVSLCTATSDPLSGALPRNR